jgi:hexosaminidase
MRKEDQKTPYPWRGVLIDESRHFLGREEIVRVIGLMHRLGYNRLHWHLSDDQGFRIALKDRPEVKRISTKRDYTLEGCPLGKRTKNEAANQGFYTESELKEIAGIAASKGIEIVPEIDMPGHMSALLAAYPRFSCGRKPFGVETTWGVFDHPLNIGDPKAVAFAKEIVDEVVAIFGCRYFHLGFDEIRRKALKSDPAC